MNVYDTAHYATSLRQRLRRGLELGPKYYLVDLPRYAQQRRKLGLPVLDVGALWSPLRSFLGKVYVDHPLPPRYADALALLDHAGVKLANPRARTEALVAMWWQTREVAGDAIECGAYRGATSLLLAVLGHLHGVRQRVLVLDTFVGMPAPSRYDSSRAAGEFAPPAGWVDVLAGWARALDVADRVEICQGLFADTFAALSRRELAFAFCHVDANIYQSTLEACAFTLPRMVKGGAVVFDDYNGLADLGARLAIDAYLGARPKPLPLAECSAYLRT